MAHEQQSVIETEHSILIARDPEDILDFLLDHERMEEWMDGLVESAPTSAGAPHVGSTYHQVMQIGGRLARVNGVVTEYHPPCVLAYRARIGAMTITSRWDLTPTEHGTRVRYSERSIMSGMVFRVMEPLIRLAMRHRHASTFARLKCVAEALPRRV